MSVESAKTAETDDDSDTTAERFETALVAVLSGVDESAEPWKLRPPDTTTGPMKLLIGAQPGLVRGQLALVIALADNPG